MDNYKEKFKDFRLAKLRFVLKPHDFIKLSNFAGSSLRKDFISIFKQISCLDSMNICNKYCVKRQDCPYAILFEDGVTLSNNTIKQYQNPPKPFIFDSPVKKKTLFSRNEELYFDLVLMGNVLAYFPYFLASMRRLGEMGLGWNHGKFKLTKIIAYDLVKDSVAAVFDFMSSDPDINQEVSFSLGELYDKYASEYDNVQDVEVAILTPLRMKRLCNENWHLIFRTLVKNILTRISNIAYSFCDFDEFYQFPEPINTANSVRIINENLTWEDWRNPKMRNKNPNSKLGGYYGTLEYKGDMTEHWPILRLGELVHIGKNTSFGLGRIKVTNITSA